VITLVETDWLELWRKLATTSAPTSSKGRVGTYKARVRRKTVERPDLLLDFVQQNTDSQSTVLDVGAGNGRWTIPLARITRNVTAVEPSATMRDILRHNITDASLNNIQIVPVGWEEANVEPHDVVVCAHAMYSSPDFADFVGKMERHARKSCYLAVRLPPHDGIIGELSLSIYEHPHDSPNAIIAYNALYSMGIYANVLVEEGIYYWINTTLEEALARAKRHLHLEASATHDELIRNTLTRRLTYKDNSYIWPDGMRSALFWWSPQPVSE